MSVFVCICLHIAAVIVGFFNSVCVCGCVGFILPFKRLLGFSVVTLDCVRVYLCVFVYGHSH